MQRRIRWIVLTAVFGFVALAAPGNGASVSSDSVTFTKDVAPIFYKNCAYCHRPGEIAPMSLINYKDARPWAKSIREKVLDGTVYGFKEDSHIMNLMPHMHLRGKDFEYRLIYPDGTSKVILSVPRYSFT